MSLPHSYTTADYLPWEVALALIERLFEDGDYRMSLFIGCGCCLGMKTADLLSLKWVDLLSDDDKVLIQERSTGKRRIITKSMYLISHIERCKNALCIPDYREFCFLNRYKKRISVQMVNRKLKSLKNKYHLPIKNFSTHSLRKTWGRKYYYDCEEVGRAEEALAILRRVFNQANVNVTKKYLAVGQVSKVKPIEL